MTDLIGSGGFGPRGSFWSKPEGKTGAFFAAGLVGLVGWGLYKVLPYAISIISNMLYLSLLCVGLAAVIYVVTDKQMRTLVWYLYRSLMRAITGVFVEIDPIGIVETYIKHLWNSIRKLREQTGYVKKQINILDEMIRTADEDREKSMKIMSKAKESGKQNVLTFEARRAGRRHDTSMTYKRMKEQLEVVYRVLIKLTENAELVARDKEDEVEQAKIRYKTMKAAKSALRSAISVLRGDPDKAAIFEQAMDHMAGEVAMAMGEIDFFLDTSRGFLDSLDLQNMSYEADALEQLKEWEKRSDTILLPPAEKQLILAESTSPLTPLRIEAPQAVTQRRKAAGSDFDAFLDR